MARVTPTTVRMMECEASGKHVHGSAKYAGAAGGLYVKHGLAADGKVTSSTNGAFTAAVALTANFGGTAVAEANRFSISGMVSKFMDGETDLGWTLKLMKAPFATATH